MWMKPTVCHFDNGIWRRLYKWWKHAWNVEGLESPQNALNDDGSRTSSQKLNTWIVEKRSNTDSFIISICSAQKPYFFWFLFHSVLKPVFKRCLVSCNCARTLSASMGLNFLKFCRWHCYVESGAFIHRVHTCTWSERRFQRAVGRYTYQRRCVTVDSRSWIRSNVTEWHWNV